MVYSANRGDKSFVRGFALLFFVMTVFFFAAPGQAWTKGVMKVAENGGGRVKGTRTSDKRKEAEAEARKLFFEGMRYFKLGRFEDAIRSFERSFNLAKRPVVLFNLAMSHRAVSDYLSSIAVFKEYRAMLGKDIEPERAELVDKMVVEMESELGRIVIDAHPVPVDLFIRGKKVGVVHARKSVDVNPGEHSVEIRKKGFLPFARKVLVAPGERVEVRARLEKMKSRKGRLVISCSIPSAMISIGGGRPVALPVDMELDPGIHDVRITAPGHLAEVLEVSVSAGEVIEKKNVSLEKATPRIVPGEPGEKQGLPGREIDGERRDEDERADRERVVRPFYKKAWFWTVIGAAVIGVSAGGGYLIWHSTRDGKDSHDVIYNLR